MAEWDDRRYVKDFINNHNGLNYLDGITYHEYVDDNSISSIINGGTDPGLTKYGIPIIVDEYGSREYGSNGINGALWNSTIVTNLVKNGIQPIQFPFFEFPGIGSEYSSMGLFYNWDNGWQLKDSFWVYSNIFRFIKDTEILNSNGGINNLDILAVKKNGEVNLVVTNQNTAPQALSINIQNMPASFNNVEVYDNLQDNHVTSSFSISSNTFSYTVPAKSSVTLSLNASEISCNDGDDDGYGDPASSDCTHPERDCDDSNANINPAAVEICDNGLDDDCDGNTDENCGQGTFMDGQIEVNPNDPA